ncbi:MAG: transposase [Deltaproteobacteria bacterium]|nr:transposase [Deltaproteobacteria bacterium]
MRCDDQRQVRALFRHGVISQVNARQLQGSSLSEAKKEEAKVVRLTPSGQRKRISEKAISRWLAAYEKHGFAGLFDKERERTDSSVVLPKKFIDYLKKQKKEDPKASIPEIISRAEADDVLTKTDKVSRVTAYRCARRLNLPIFKKKELGKGDMRRFAKSARMTMCLCDGKHFKAGQKRRRRVVLTFMDDAHRFALRAVVGTSENAALFMRGLFETIMTYGLMSVIYVDLGPGFIAKVVQEVCAKIGLSVIYGRPKYPQGRGKIERYHDTLINDLLRGLDGNPNVDPDPAALELRINHYLSEIYNKRHHEGIKGVPEDKFLADDRPLKRISEEELRTHFVIHLKRKVSNDNIIKVNSIPYEMPLGHAGTRVVVHHHLLDRTVSFCEHGKMLLLSEVDPHANAKTPRGRRGKEAEEKALPHETAAMKRFNKQYTSLVAMKYPLPKG